MNKDNSKLGNNSTPARGGGDIHHSESTINDDLMSMNNAPYPQGAIIPSEGLLRGTKSDVVQLGDTPFRNRNSTLQNNGKYIGKNKQSSEVLEFDQDKEDDDNKLNDLSVKNRDQDNQNNSQRSGKSGSKKNGRNAKQAEQSNLNGNEKYKDIEDKVMEMEMKLKDPDGKTKPPTKDQSHDLSIKKQYISRRTKVYEDSQSEDDDYIQTEGQKPQDTGVITYQDTKGNVTNLKPNLRFLPYRNVFKDLLKQTQVITKNPIVSMIITYDSTKAITVTKQDDCFCYIKMYDLEEYNMTFDECIGGEGRYIKFKEIEQNSAGKEFAALYNDDGVWYLRTFGKESRTKREIEENEIEINAMIGIDDSTMCNEMFPDPFGNCCWITDDQIFVVVFHNYTRTHYHVIIDIRKRQIVGQVSTHQFNCNLKQFPYKTFYSVQRHKIYTFYRQGQVFNINPENPTDFSTQQIIDKDLGQMIMFGGECLIVRSSGSIYFFKQEVDKMTDVESWQLIHTMKVRGFIYYIKGNIRIQVTTDEIIYFYIIDKETFLPCLENVMYNYMGCNQMMFGSKVRYGITYKTNQKSFDIYRRKFMHNLKVNVLNDNLEGAFGLSLPQLKCFLVAKVDQVKIYSAQTFRQIGSIPIKLLQTQTREPNEIIGMTKSKCEKFLAIISGKQLIMNKQAQNQLFIFKMVESNDDAVIFEQINRIVVKDIPEFKNVCMQFHFRDFEAEPNELIFCKSTEIFYLNIQTYNITTVHKFKPALLSQPQYYCISADQDIHVLASFNDGVWYNHKEDEEIDLDEHYKIDLIKNIVYDDEDKVFYLLCNKKREALGFFLIKFNETNPLKKSDITQWKHKLEIGDCNISVLRGIDQVTKKYYKELVISYKTIYINTYNVYVQDISGPDDKRTTLYIHESFQLWESQVSGLMLTQNKDFISISKAGLNILSLGAIPKRKIKDNEGQDKMIHSLDAQSFLKIDPINYIKFECQDYNNRVISIDQEYKTGLKNTDNHETKFFSAYKIKISEVTLRELLILQSFYLCKTQSDIVNLVKLQPTPTFFYKSFLELDLSTMASILAFDSGSIDALLNESNEEYFDETYPIIFKNKIPKKQGNDFYYRSAIQNALRNNQIQSVNLMINYIVKYQNNYISSNLFTKTLPNLVEKGVSVVSLFNSNVFQYTFDYDEWPGNHSNDEECIRPYNHSIFQLRQFYSTVYPEPEFKPIDEFSEDNKDQAQPDSQKVYKIKFSINLLPSVGQYFAQDPENENQINCINEGIDFMGVLASSEEIELFDSQNIMDIIEFKWDTFGQNHHMFGGLMHIFYVLLIGAYICIYYCYHEEDNNTDYLYTGLLAVGILYPWIYDLIQLIKDGPKTYFSDIWNWVDFYYIYGGILNIVFQLTLGKSNAITRVNFCLIIIILIMKTFFFLRIMESFTPIVIMMTNVIYDLRIFMLFYTILLFIFSLMFSVIGIGLDQIQRPEETLTARRLAERELKARAGSSGVVKVENDKIPSEYKFLGMFVGQFMTALRVSIGDFSCISSVTTLTVAENWLFWFIWLIAVIITNVVFLNFIVAEASASYAKVTDTLDAVIQKEKASMISESEQMTSKKNKMPSSYPPYLIVRTIET